MNSNPEPKSTPPYYRPEIDGMRAVAILSVLLYHAFPSLIPGGYMGVDVFFVISGYLISSILLRENQQGPISISQFYIRRIRRIFPALTLMLVTVLIAGLFWLLPKDLMKLGRQISSAGIFLANFQFYSETGYFDTAAEAKPLLHLWSLGIEEQFYIFWPLLIFFARKISRIKKSLILLICGSFLLNLAFVHSRPEYTFFLPYTRVWELGIGGLISMVSLQGQRQLPIPRWLKGLLGYTSFAVFLFGVLYFDKTSPFPGAIALIPVLSTAVWILLGSETSITKIVLTDLRMVKIGLVSYPLYLWHWPLLAFSVHLDFSFLKSNQGHLLLLILAFILASLTEKLWEVKFRGFTTWSQIRPMLVYPMIGLIVFGIAISQSDGLIWRYPEILRPLFKINPTDPPEWRTHECFLSENQPYSQFSKTCAASKVGTKKVLLWGDSHAAHLYPGLAKWGKETNQSIIQFTASGCPPILGLSSHKRSFCTEINNFVFNSILSSALPDEIILAAYWDLYQDAEWGTVRFEDLQNTILEIKKLGKAKIKIIGPFPIWTKPLPEILINEYLDSKSLSDFRDKDLNKAATFTTDSKIQSWAKKLGVDYIAPVNYLCKIPESCRTHLQTESAIIPISSDYGHLTIPASIDLISELMKSKPAD